MRESTTANEWKREGAVEHARRTLRRLLQQRFGELPTALLERIEATSDLDELDRALDQVHQISKPEDLPL